MVMTFLTVPSAIFVPSLTASTSFCISPVFLRLRVDLNLFCNREMNRSISTVFISLIRSSPNPQGADVYFG